MTLARAAARPGRRRVRRRRRLPPADDRRAADPADRSASSGGGDLRDGLPDGEVFGVCAVPGAGSVRDLRRSSRPPTARRAGGRGRRPARADPAHPPGELGCRRRARHHAALRRAAGLRRARTPPTCRWGQKLAAPAPRPAGRGVGRRRRPTRLRLALQTRGAAHPPREGHVEHLHRAGAARRRRRRATPSTTAPTGCVASRSEPTAWRPCWPRGLRAGGVEVVHGEFFDTVHARVPASWGARDDAVAPPPTTPGSRCAGWTRHRRHRLLRGHRRRAPADRLVGLRRASGDPTGDPTGDVAGRTRRPPTRCPRACPGPATT
jgi:hypothetical protein